MSFTPEWLALREPADMAARDAGLLSQAIQAAGPNATVLDLGSGTGSTARAFADGIGHGGQWRFVDSDKGLLDVAHQQHPNSECHVLNLRDLDDLPLDGVSLVTASALLDLMPQGWVSDLAARLSNAAVPFYACLNYDGIMQWSPPFTADASIVEDFNKHQMTDKGIGTAMGPVSGQRTADIFARHGFDVTVSQSPWRIGADQSELNDQLISGIADAASQMGNPFATTWATTRRADLGQTHTTVGHTDILAVPQKRNAHV